MYVNILLIKMLEPADNSLSSPGFIHSTQWVNKKCIYWFTLMDKRLYTSRYHSTREHFLMSLLYTINHTCLDTINYEIELVKTYLKCRELIPVLFEWAIFSNYHRNFY